jgi:hypothetical protein
MQKGYVSFLNGDDWYGEGRELTVIDLFQTFVRIKYSCIKNYIQMFLTYFGERP